MRRYGPPTMQRFAAGSILISVECNHEFRVVAIETAPEGYQRNVYNPNLLMDRAAVTELPDFFVPPQRRRGMPESLGCLGNPSKPRSGCGCPKATNAVRAVKSEPSVTDTRTQTLRILQKQLD